MLIRVCKTLINKRKRKRDRECDIYSELGETLLGEHMNGPRTFSVTDVPMARTTTPDSPSRSKHCRYLKINNNNNWHVPPHRTLLQNKQKSTHR